MGSPWGDLARYFEVMGQYGQAYNEDKTNKDEATKTMKDAGLNVDPIYGSVRISNDSDFYEKPVVRSIEKSDWLLDEDKDAVINDLLKKYYMTMEGTSPNEINGQQFHIGKNLNDEQFDVVAGAIDKYTSTPADKKELIKKISEMAAGQRPIGETLEGVASMPEIDLSVGSDALADKKIAPGSQPDSILMPEEKRIIRERMARMQANASEFE